MKFVPTNFFNYVCHFSNFFLLEKYQLMEIVINAYTHTPYQKKMLNCFEKYFE